MAGACRVVFYRCGRVCGAGRLWADGGEGPL